jgi:hypothetical protein
VVDAVQASGGGSVLHGAAGQAELSELIEAEDGVLGRCDRRQVPVQRGLDVKNSDI